MSETIDRAKTFYSTMCESMGRFSDLGPIDTIALMKYDVIRITGIAYIFADGNERKEYEKIIQELLELDNTKRLIEEFIDSIDAETIVRNFFCKLPYSSACFHMAYTSDETSVFSYLPIELIHTLLLAIICPDGTMAINAQSYLVTAYIYITKRHLKAIGIKEVDFVGVNTGFEEVKALYNKEFDEFEPIDGVRDAKSIYETIKNSIIEGEIEAIYENADCYTSENEYSIGEYVEITNKIKNIKEVPEEYVGHEAGNKITESLTELDTKTKTTENPDTSRLKELVQNYPYIWKDSRRLRALLMDYFAENKLLRNLLIVSAEEGIPEELLAMGMIDRNNMYRLQKLIISSMGCTDELAESAVTLWADSLGCHIIKNGNTLPVEAIKVLSIDKLKLSSSTNEILKDAGINSISDLLAIDQNRFLKMRWLGRRWKEEILVRLAETGIPYETYRHLYELIQEELLENQDTVEQQDKDSGLSIEQEQGIESNLEEIHNFLKIPAILKKASYRKMMGDYAGYIENLETAVEFGYDGDYSVVGMAYMTGKDLPIDKINGLIYLLQFYDAYHCGKLRIDNTDMMPEVCIQLGALYLERFCNNKTGESVSNDDLNRALTLWKESIDLVRERKTGYISDERETEDYQIAKDLVQIGSFFYYGKIQSRKYDDESEYIDKAFNNADLFKWDEVRIQSDYEYAYKAFREADRIGCLGKAKEFLAEMYLEGRWVDKNVQKALLYYLQMVNDLDDENKATKFCQKWFINDLPWDKRSDWSDISIYTILQKSHARGIPYDNELVKHFRYYSLEEYRYVQFKFFSRYIWQNHRALKILSIIRSYVIEYDSYLHEDVKTAIDIDGVVKCAKKFGYDKACGHESQEVFSWLNEFYTSYSNKSLRLKKSYKDIARVEYKLGVCYAYGIGVKGDLAKCKALWTKMIIHAKQEHSYIVMNVAKSFYFGELAIIKGRHKAFEVDYKQAYRAFRKLSVKGNAEATFYLAKMFEDGNYVDKDEQHALMLYKVSAADDYRFAKIWIKEHSIESLDFSAHLYSCLRRANIYTVSDLLSTEYDRLTSINYLSQADLEEVFSKLADVNLPYEVTDLSDRTKQQIWMPFIRQISEKTSIGDYGSAEKLLEKAIVYGYKNDYSDIVQTYLSGGIVKRDIKKAIKWLSRFYSDYQTDNVAVDNKYKLVQICQNLGAAYLWRLQEEKSSDSICEENLYTTLSLWKDAINIATSLRGVDIDEEEKPKIAEMIWRFGCTFYYGEIQTEGHDNLLISKDYECAYKAFTEAKWLHNSAKTLVHLAMMYEEGNYVEKDSHLADVYYLEAAIKHDETAMEWCQKRFIDNLPWNKRLDWSGVDIHDMGANNRCSLKNILILDIQNMEDYKNMDFKKISRLLERKSFTGEDARRLLNSIVEFVENFSSDD